MEWLIAHAETVGALCGAATAAWAFFSKIERTYRNQLKADFATKDDFHRLESKLDTILMSPLRPVRRKRKQSRIA